MGVNTIIVKSTSKKIKEPTIDTSMFEGSDFYLSKALKESVVLNIRVAKVMGITKEEVEKGGLRIKKDNIPYVTKYWDAVAVTA